MAILTPLKHKFYDDAGLPLAGGLVYTYQPGTTTLLTTYTDSTGLVAQANPIVLDAKGECNIWSSSMYKVNVTTAAGAQVTGWPVDNVGQGQSSYDISGFAVGVPIASQILLRIPMVRAVTFDVNLTLSKASASVAATAATVLTISKNGVQFGTITFGIGSVTGVFAAAIPPAFAINDIITVTAPLVPDVTLANIGFILAGQIVP